MSTKRALAALALAATPVLAACTAAGPQRTAAPSTGGGDAVVRVRDSSFSPSSVKIATGEVVAWSWDGHGVHDVSFDSGPSSPKQRDGSWEHRFEQPGTYRYECSLHRQMRGTVTVS
jgi:plastocyanin